MKLVISLVSMLFCLASVGTVLGANESINESATNAENESYTYVFIQEGDSGSFTKDESGNYTLVIKGVVPYTIYFSDRPARDAGFVEMEKFISGFSWDPANPPNAAVMLKNETEDKDVIVVELTSPAYDKANQTLTYTAKVVADYVSESQWHQDLVQRADDAIPERFDHVVIAIDDCPCAYIDRSECSTCCHDQCWQWKPPHCSYCAHCCKSWECYACP